MRSTSGAALDSAVATQLRAWFDDKLVVVEDAGASGEEVVETVVEATPPGYRNRVMGMQNIKGTGLDFAYRWLAWDAVHGACTQLTGDDARERDAGAQTLVAFQEFGWLAEDAVRSSLARAAADPTMQKEATRAQFAAIEAALDAALGKLRNRQGSTNAGSTAGGRWREPLEQVLDSFDAVLRRRRADAIYRDLIEERVSPERAALELAVLNKRQKGGWLRARK